MADQEGVGQNEKLLETKFPDMGYRFFHKI